MMNKTLIIVENYNDLREVSEIIQGKLGKVNSYIQTPIDTKIKSEHSYVLITRKEDEIREYNFDTVLDLRHSVLVKEWLSDKVLELANGIVF